MLDTRPTLLRHMEEYKEWCRVRGEVQDQATTVVTPLYHYTNQAAFCGIVGNEEFWFTDINHLNDPSEFRHGCDIAIEALTAHPLRAHKIINFLCDPLADTIRTRFNEIFSMHVASFSALDDNLSQWRAYGDSGRGVAIEFAPAFFGRGPESNIVPDGSLVHPTIVTPMAYDDAMTRAQLQQEIDRAFTTVKELAPVFAMSAPDVGLAFVREFVSLLSLQIMMEACSAKHPGYVAEAEVRLVIHAQRKNLERFVEIRQRNGQPIRFVRQKLRIRDHVTKVLLGPLADAEMEAKVRAVLSDAGLQASQILHRSKLPMRAY
jgi:hypothetical protein